MGFNYSKEKILFNKKWTSLRENYARQGMSEKSIQELYDFDWSWFKMRRVYENHVQMLPEEEIDEQNTETRTNLFLKYSSLLTEFDESSFIGRYAWVESISNAKLAESVKKLTVDELELLTLIAIEGFSQREIAIKMCCSQNAISKKLIKLKSILKKI